ncbi:MAG: hypothetical protein ACRCVZ_05265 [Aestuariivirga sp.]
MGNELRHAVAGERLEPCAGLVRRMPQDAAPGKTKQCSKDVLPLRGKSIGQGTPEGDSECGTAGHKDCILRRILGREKDGIDRPLMQDLQALRGHVEIRRCKCPDGADAIAPLVQADLHANRQSQVGMRAPQRQVDHAAGERKFQRCCALKTDHDELQAGVPAKQPGNGITISIRDRILRDEDKGIGAGHACRFSFHVEGVKLPRSCQKAASTDQTPLNCYLVDLGTAALRVTLLVQKKSTPRR